MHGSQPVDELTASVEDCDPRPVSKGPFPFINTNPIQLEGWRIIWNTLSRGDLEIYAQIMQEANLAHEDSPRISYD